MRSFGYFWKEGFRNIFHHGFMSIGAVIIMVACLLITGTVTLVAYNINQNIIGLQQSNEIVAYIDEDELNKDVPDRTYAYGGTGFETEAGNGGSALAYMRELFGRAGK